jgi:thioredoxin-like negative regulator of GroEL
MTRKIEVFSAGCPACKETIDMVTKVAGTEHQVSVRDMQQTSVAADAKRLGIKSLPAVVVDGKLAGCCAGRGPNEGVIREALR